MIDMLHNQGPKSKGENQTQFRATGKQKSKRKAGLCGLPFFD
jgi:hypothetical protein